MPNSPFLNATLRITARDLNNNNVVKNFYNVTTLNVDYNDGTINVIDKTGSFYFPLKPATTVTYTITPGVNGVHAIVIS